MAEKPRLGAIVETAHAWEQEGTTTGTVRDIIGAVDETFLERMMLVCMDLPQGHSVFGALMDNRHYPK